MTQAANASVRMRAIRALAAAFAVVCAVDVASQTPPRAVGRWTQFVTVDGQPEPVPAEWVSTPEGKFAHSIKIPNPVPKDSGYRPGMTSQQYFEHLCRTEAGEFIYRRVENVEGFYFMRPPRRPSDRDLMDRFKLEDPYTERVYQLIPDRVPDRPGQFVNPPYSNYKFVEEPRRDVIWQRGVSTPYIRAHGYKFDVALSKTTSSMQVEGASVIASKFGYTWRGLIRTNDRELGIAGRELLVLELSSGRPLAVLRNFTVSGKASNTSGGLWWLNARSCPQFPETYRDNIGRHLYEFLSGVLKPTAAAGAT
jgi:hypothetical protein